MDEQKVLTDNAGDVKERQSKSAHVESEHSTIAAGLPSWSIEPPAMPIRRKSVIARLSEELARLKSSLI